MGEALLSNVKCQMSNILKILFPKSAFTPSHFNAFTLLCECR